MRATTVIPMLIVVVASAAAIVSAGDRPVERLSGSYDWSDGGSDELSATFKPDGAGRWEIEFSFRFSGKKNKWRGSATGSLDEGGQLSGTSSWRGREWEFEAEMKDGVLRGEHAEIRPGGDRYGTGSFELRR